MKNLRYLTGLVVFLSLFCHLAAYEYTFHDFRTLMSEANKNRANAMESLDSDTPAKEYTAQLEVLKKAAAELQQNLVKLKIGGDLDFMEIVSFLESEFRTRPARFKRLKGASPQLRDPEDLSFVRNVYRDYIKSLEELHYHGGETPRIAKEYRPLTLQFELKRLYEFYGKYTEGTKSKTGKNGAVTNKFEENPRFQMFVNAKLNRMKAVGRALDLLLSSQDEALARKFRIEEHVNSLINAHRILSKKQTQFESSLSSKAKISDKDDTPADTGVRLQYAKRKIEEYLDHALKDAIEECDARIKEEQLEEAKREKEANQAAKLTPERDRKNRDDAPEKNEKEKKSEEAPLVRQSDEELFRKIDEARARIVDPDAIGKTLSNERMELFRATLTDEQRKRLRSAVDKYIRAGKSKDEANASAVNELKSVLGNRALTPTRKELIEINQRLLKLKGKLGTDSGMTAKPVDSGVVVREKSDGNTKLPEPLKPVDGPAPNDDGVSVIWK